jgi:hypothetical protein
MGRHIRLFFVHGFAGFMEGVAETAAVSPAQCLKRSAAFL